MVKFALRQRQLGGCAGILTLLVGLAGCSPNTGGQTGEDCMTPCTEDTIRLASIDTMSPLGFSASQILAFAAGKHESTLLWRENNGLIAHSDRTTTPAGSYSPGPGETEVWFTVAYNDGEISFKHREARPGLADPSTCNDVLEIDVTASLVTSDGALDEILFTKLYAHTSQQAEWASMLPSSSILGSFRVMPNEPLEDEATLYLSGSVTPRSMVGHLSGDPNYSSNSDVLLERTTSFAPGEIDYADWPATTGCEGFGLPLDVDLAMQYAHFIGSSPNDALALINDSPTMPLRGISTDGRARTMTARVVADVQPACVRTSTSPRANGGVTLNLRGRAYLTTDDASATTEFPVRIEALPDWRGGISWATFDLEGSYDTGVAPGELCLAFGYAEMDQNTNALATCMIDGDFVASPTGTRAIVYSEVVRYVGATCVQGPGNAGCIAQQVERKAWSTP